MSKLAMCGLIAAATLIGIGPGNAFGSLFAPLDRGAWCVHYDIGAGVVREECTLPNFETCNVERARWGTTAFCTQNPNFAGYRPEQAEPRHRKRRHHR